MKVTVNERHPGSEPWTKPKAPGNPKPRLNRQPVLYIFAAADVGVDIDALGLLVWELRMGDRTIRAGVVLPDGLSLGTRRRLQRWAGARSVETLRGTKAREVSTISRFMDYKDGLFPMHSYSGARTVVGADLLRTLGLCAEFWVPRKGEHADGWELFPPGWGRRTSTGTRRVSPHRPPLRANKRQIHWAPTERGFGKRHPGAFVDVLNAATALDADESGSFSEHRENLGLARASLPIRVTVGPKGADLMVEALSAVMELTTRCDEEGSRYFTSPRDQAEQRTGLDLSSLSSAAGISSQILPRWGIRPPRETFALTEEEGVPLHAAFHGGRQDLEPSLVGVPIPVVAADIPLSFGRAADDIGWWSQVTADHIDRIEATDDFTALRDQVRTNPTVPLTREEMRWVGVTLVEVRPRGERCLTNIVDPRRPDGRAIYVPTSFAPGCPRQTLYFSGFDLLAMAADGSAPEIVSALRYIAVGRQPIRRRLRFLPGLVFDADEGPIVPLYRQRCVAKDRRGEGWREANAAHHIRLLLLTLVYGNCARADTVRVRREQRWVTVDRPGPGSCLPLASSITAACRYKVALLSAKVVAAGGTPAYSHTDSVLIPSCPAGGEVIDNAGHTVTLLPTDLVVKLARSCDPEPTDWPSWKLTTGTDGSPLCSVILGALRHIEYCVTDGDIHIVDLTESNLGGWFASPAGRTGRNSETGRKQWTTEAAKATVEYLLCRRARPSSALRPEEAWGTDTPAVRPLKVVSPEILRTLPTELGARPGSYYLEGSVTALCPSSAPVALDTGDPDYLRRRWLDRHTGAPVTVSVDFTPGTVVLSTLGREAHEWATSAPEADPVESVEIVAVRHVGRVSGIIEASNDGVLDIGTRQAVYDEGDIAAAVIAEARRLGPKVFAAAYDVPLSTAKHLSAGRPPNRDTIVKVLGTSHVEARTCDLEGCPEPVTGKARYCRPAHKEAARRARNGKPPRGKRVSSLHARCLGCGCILVGALDDGRCFDCEESVAS